MKRWAWTSLLLAGLVLTVWLTALRPGHERDRARPRSDGPSAVMPSDEPPPTEGTSTSARTETPSGGEQVRTEAVAPVPTETKRPKEAVEHREPRDSRWVDPVLSALSSVPSANATPLARRDGRKGRHDEQLEALRQCQCVTLLDHIRAGLAWLALHQAPDGHLSEAASAARCRELGHDPACVQLLQPSGNVLSTTGLALAAMVDFRDQDKEGLFEPSLAAAARWLARQQRSDGSFSFPGREDYAAGTAIALTALGRAAASSGEADLHAAVERGLAHVAGDPVHAGFSKTDLNTVAYVAQAIEAARRADVPVPPDLETQLRAYLDRVWSGDHRFRQSPGTRGEQPNLFAVGMVASLILREERDAALMETWRAWLGSRPSQPRVALLALLRRAHDDPTRGGAAGPVARLAPRRRGEPGQGGLERRLLPAPAQRLVDGSDDPVPDVPDRGGGAGA